MFTFELNCIYIQTENNVLIIIRITFEYNFSTLITCWIIYNNIIIIIIIIIHVWLNYTLTEVRTKLVQDE